MERPAIESQGSVVPPTLLTSSDSDVFINADEVDRVIEKCLLLCLCSGPDTRLHFWGVHASQRRPLLLPRPSDFLGVFELYARDVAVQR